MQAGHRGVYPQPAIRRAQQPKHGGEAQFRAGGLWQCGQPGLARAPAPQALDAAHPPAALAVFAQGHDLCPAEVGHRAGSGAAARRPGRGRDGRHRPLWRPQIVPSTPVRRRCTRMPPRGQACIRPPLRRCCSSRPLRPSHRLPSPPRVMASTAPPSRPSKVARTRRASSMRNKVPAWVVTSRSPSGRASSARASASAQGLRGSGSALRHRQSGGWAGGVAGPGHSRPPRWRRPDRAARRDLFARQGAGPAAPLRQARQDGRGVGLEAVQALAASDPDAAVGALGQGVHGLAIGLDQPAQLALLPEPERATGAADPKPAEVVFQQGLDGAGRRRQGQCLRRGPPGFAIAQALPMPTHSRPLRAASRASTRVSGPRSVGCSLTRSDC